MAPRATMAMDIDLCWPNRKLAQKIGEPSSSENDWKVTFLLSLVAAASFVPDTDDDDGDDDADADDELRSSSKQQFIIRISLSSWSKLKRVWTGFAFYGKKLRIICWPADQTKAIAEFEPETVASKSSLSRFNSD